VTVAITFGILRGTTDFAVKVFNEDAFYVGVGVCFACMLCTPLLLVCYLMGKTEIKQTVLVRPSHFFTRLF